MRAAGDSIALVQDKLANYCLQHYWQTHFTQLRILESWVLQRPAATVVYQSRPVRQTYQGRRPERDHEPQCYP